MPATVTGADKVNANLAAAVAGIQARAKIAGEEIAKLLEEYAKNNHPWQNDTGDTERTTKAAVTEATNTLLTVTLTTGTDYSKFLELAKSGKWAWLWPAMLACEQQIKEILTRTLGLKAANSFGFAMSKSYE